MFYYIEIGILVLIVVLDSMQFYPIANAFKYLSIIGCLLMTIYQCYLSSKWKYLLPLLLICFADYYLLFTTNYSYGVLLFFLVQNSYYYLLKQKISVIPLYILILLLWLPISFLDIIVIVYSIITIINLYTSYNQYQNNPYLFYTISLLSLCDLCVALQYLTLLLPYSSLCIWIFYLPSQLFYIKSIDNSKKKRIIV